MSTAFAVFVVKPTGYIHSQVFTETAHCIHSGLISLGYDTVLTEDHETVPDRRLIVVGPNLLPFAGIHVLPAGTILYNLEQYAHWSNPFLRDDRYVLWDFSAENARRLGLKPKAILPIGYCTCMRQVEHAQKKDIDVLFIGSPSPRRGEIINRIRQNGLKVQEVFGVYDEERNTLIARAKVQINIHYAPGALMEQPRLSYLMANNCVVLSEPSSFEPENEEWGAGCTLAPYDQLPLSAEFLVDASAITTKELKDRALHFMEQRPIEHFLSDALTKTL